MCYNVQHFSTGLQPTPVNLLQATPTPQNNTTNNNNPKPTTKLGATWADTKGAINIDVDNLLGPRSPKIGPAPSINQLKSTPNSPAHKPLTPSANPLPPMGYQFPPMNNNFNQSGSLMNNNQPTAFANHNNLLQ